VAAGRARVDVVLLLGAMSQQKLFMHFATLSRSVERLDQAKFEQPGCRRNAVSVASGIPRPSWARLFRRVSCHIFPRWP
jgi:hypothetical protein